MSARPRQAGSVRFDPYWKVQWYDERSLTWRDVQKAHQTITDAWDAADDFTEGADGATTRLMEITMGGRHPIHRKETT